MSAGKVPGYRVSARRTNVGFSSHNEGRRISRAASRRVSQISSRSGASRISALKEKFTRQQELAPDKARADE